jgi:polynucleotide 5'-kinase involved in rRNA processing
MCDPLTIHSGFNNGKSFVDSTMLVAHLTIDGWLQKRIMALMQGIQGSDESYTDVLVGAYITQHEDLDIRVWIIYKATKDQLSVMAGPSITNVVVALIPAMSSKYGLYLLDQIQHKREPNADV